jgi:hypothetical protein
MNTATNTPSILAEDWAHCADCDSYGLRRDMHKIIEWPTGKKLISLVCDACYWAETDNA